MYSLANNISAMMLRRQSAANADPILALFSGGEQGAYYDPSDSSTVFQDAAMTTPAGANDPVGALMDKSGNGNHATQSMAAARPIRRTDGTHWWLDGDGIDDTLSASSAITLMENHYWAGAFSIDTRSGPDGKGLLSSSNVIESSASSSDALGIYQRSDVVERVRAAMRIGVGSSYIGELNGAFTIGTPFIGEAYHESNVLTASNALASATLAADDNTTSANRGIRIFGNGSKTKFYGGICLMRVASPQEKTAVREWLQAASGVTL